MPEKILVIDNDSTTRLTSMASLMRAGYQLCLAEDSFNALGVALEEQPDLILLGDSMARPESLPLIGRLFSDPGTAAIPVAVIAASAENRDAALRAGARGVYSGAVTDPEFLGFVQQNLLVEGPLPGVPQSVLDDPDRLAAVAALRPGPEGNTDLDRFTQLAARMLNAPVSLITLIDRDQQVYASQVGLAPPGTQLAPEALETSFCQFAVTSRQPLRIDDSTTHPLVEANPTVETLNVKAYVGIPLLVGGSQAVGALCAIDSTPRHWTDHEVAILNDLAGILTAHLDTIPSNPGRHSV